MIETFNIRARRFPVVAKVIPPSLTDEGLQGA